MPLHNRTQLEALELDSPEDVRRYLDGLGLSTEVMFKSGSQSADKETLIGVPLAFIQWEFKASEQYGSEYVVVNYVDMNTGVKGVFSDGGSGICKQLSEITDKRIEAGLPGYNGLTVPNGLRRSDYTTPNGVKASTYWLA